MLFDLNKVADISFFIFFKTMYNAARGWLFYVHVYMCVWVSVYVCVGARKLHTFIENCRAHISLILQKYLPVFYTLEGVKSCVGFKEAFLK